MSVVQGVCLCCVCMLVNQYRIQQFTPTTDIEFHKMESVFESALEISSQCILIVKDYGMALFTQDDQFHLFDPHSRNDQGYSMPDGHAVLIIFKTIHDLCTHLRQLTSTLTEDSLASVAFEITPTLVYTTNSPSDSFNLTAHYGICSSAIITCTTEEKYIHKTKQTLKVDNKKKFSKTERSCARKINVANPDLKEVQMYSTEQDTLTQYTSETASCSVKSMPQVCKTDQLQRTVSQPLSCVLKINVTKPHLKKVQIYSTKQQTLTHKNTCEIATYRVHSMTQVCKSDKLQRTVSQTSYQHSDNDCKIISDSAPVTHYYHPIDKSWQFAKAILFSLSPPKHTLFFWGLGL